MKKRFLIAILSMYSSILAMAQTTAPSQEDLSVGSVPQGLSGLQLDSTRQAALEDAIKQKDYKRAETILVEETEHDPKSIRTAKLLEIAGGLFFLDGQYLNSAIAWKKAESIAPLRAPVKYAMTRQYIRVVGQNGRRRKLKRIPVGPIQLDICHGQAEFTA